MKAGMDIVVTRQIALYGTYRLALEREEELIRRLPKAYVEEGIRLCKPQNLKKEYEVLKQYPDAAIKEMGFGGVGKALWDMAEEAKVGLEIEMRKIPVLQETIEICEFFLLNPYYLESSGSLLIAVEKGHDLVKDFEQEGIAATVIGKATNSNDRVFLNQEERRFLVKCKQDELNKIIKERVMS